jgi:hypothetical protein
MTTSPPSSSPRRPASSRTRALDKSNAAGPFRIEPGTFNCWTLPEPAILQSYRARHDEAEPRRLGQYVRGTLTDTGKLERVVGEIFDELTGRSTPVYDGTFDGPLVIFPQDRSRDAEAGETV